MSSSNIKTKTILLNGVVIGELPDAGNLEDNMLAARQFLRDKGLDREITLEQAMFHQARSFADTAASIHKTGLVKEPRNNHSFAPFIVNCAFSIELYLKTVAQVYGKSLTKEHNLLSLFDALPAEAHEKINELLPNCAHGRGLIGEIDLRSLIAELNTAFTEWRYLYEKNRTKPVNIESLILIAYVLHEVCRIKIPKPDWL